MNPVIEAAARAMHKRDNEPFEMEHGDIKDYWGELATAAIRAMMECEVTDGMVKVWNTSPVPDCQPRTMCQAEWRALLGAVVAEGGSDGR